MEEQKSNRSNTPSQNQSANAEQQQKAKKDTVQNPQAIDPNKYKNFIDEVKAKNLNSSEMLSASVLNKVHSEDSIIYNPKNIHIVNTKFPVYPLAITQKVLDKFNDDTLFFMFFVQEDSEKKVIAFNELLKRNWMYNAKYHTFFQLVGNPISKDDKFIEGKFKYFEHEKEWVVKIKKDFKFETEHLTKNISN